MAASKASCAVATSRPASQAARRGRRARTDEARFTHRAPGRRAGDAGRAPGVGRPVDRDAVWRLTAYRRPGAFRTGGHVGYRARSRRSAHRARWPCSPDRPVGAARRGSAPRSRPVPTASFRDIAAHGRCVARDGAGGAGAARAIERTSRGRRSGESRRVERGAASGVPGGNPIMPSPRATTARRQLASSSGPTCVSAISRAMPAAIPLNRVYEVSDEARRRAEFWQRSSQSVVEARRRASKGPIEMNFETPDVSSECIIDLDHHSIEFNLDELAISADLRRRCPVAWNTRYGGFWMVTSYEAVATDRTRRRHFAHKYELDADDGIDYHGRDRASHAPRASRPWASARWTAPYHAALRRALNPFLHPPGGRTALRPFIQQCVDLVHRPEDRGRRHGPRARSTRTRCPRSLTMKMMGLPYDDWAAVGRLLPLHHRATRAGTEENAQATAAVSPR